MTSGERRAARLRRRQAAAAATGTALLVLVTVFVFFIQGRVGRSSYEIDAVFRSVAGLSPGSPVRIGGRDIGVVTGTRRGPDHSAVVSMRIDDSGRPVHTDARMAVVPRLALEGSAYIKLAPGTPSASELPAGSVIPIRQTSVSVQLDQFLNTFDQSGRRALHDTLKGVAVGLGPGPPGDQGLRGSTAMREAVHALERALPSMGRAARASQGTQHGDFRRMLRSTGDFVTDMSADPVALSGLVEHFSRLMGDFAAHDRELSASVTEIDGLLREAPSSLRAVDGALPTVRRFGRVADRLLKASPRPLTRTAELLRQTQALAGRREMGALLRRTRTFVPASAELSRGLKPLFEQQWPMNRCLSERAVPVLGREVPDGRLKTGDPAWLDLLHFATNVVSVSAGYDGNGAAFRFTFAGSASMFETVLPGLGQVHGIGPTFEGVRPAWLGFNVEPPYRPDEWCYRQPLASLDIPGAPPPAWAREANR